MKYVTEDTKWTYISNQYKCIKTIRNNLVVKNFKPSTLIGIKEKELALGYFRPEIRGGLHVRLELLFIKLQTIGR